MLGDRYLLYPHCSVQTTAAARYLIGTSHTDLATFSIQVSSHYRAVIR